MIAKIDLQYLNPSRSCSSHVGDASQPPNSVKNAEPPVTALRSFCTERKSAGPSTSSQSRSIKLTGMVSLPGTGIKDKMIQ